MHEGTRISGVTSKVVEKAYNRSFFLKIPFSLNPILISILKVRQDLKLFFLNVFFFSFFFGIN